MITVVIHFYIKDEFVQQFSQITIANCADRRKAEGALRISFFQQDTHNTHFILLETFASQETIDAYYESEGYIDWEKQTKEMIVSLSGDDFSILY